MKEFFIYEEQIQALENNVITLDEIIFLNSVTIKSSLEERSKRKSILKKYNKFVYNQ